MKIRILFVLIFFVSFSALLSAAEKNTQKNTTTTEQEAKSQKPSAGKRSRVKTLEEFIPSEEVSADKPVAFPNDI